ncbi:MAG TPA: hypothetical protein VHB99_18255 [Pirellulales bacterium]|nr:hypothetical protein [Pirellulales bacterium]
MSRRPMTFGDLIARVASAPAVDTVAMSPMIASAVDLKGDGGPSDRRMWVVIHGVTDAELRLIHPQPFQSEKVAVEISSPTGEILRVVLEPAGSRQQAELFETCARFVPLGRGMLSASA